ncbi:hypothetical protein TRFO_08018 [Tritrichomonas foetus]|uniref:Leucine Rich Repeat family protein n=1 Tax=Tritrichomonas foetus TaxID=1144522 RepID=A0A1J4JNP9_9EUKA|nr:hypothetical protein TRFO_08018 [Tritrichomonas foetus]|eukprot:OHT00346.1 hypothetical protein TRFO_08018 [Tritrichomonas foetus]
MTDSLAKARKLSSKFCQNVIASVYIQKKDSKKSDRILVLTEICAIIYKDGKEPQEETKYFWVDLTGYVYEAPTIEMKFGPKDIFCFKSKDREFINDSIIQIIKNQLPPDLQQKIGIGKNDIDGFGVSARFEGFVKKQKGLNYSSLVRAVFYDFAANLKNTFQIDKIEKADSYLVPFLHAIYPCKALESLKIDRLEKSDVFGELIKFLPLFANLQHIFIDSKKPKKFKEFCDVAQNSTLKAIGIAGFELLPTHFDSLASLAVSNHLNSISIRCPIKDSNSFYNFLNDTVSKEIHLFEIEGFDFCKNNFNTFLMKLKNAIGLSLIDCNITLGDIINNIHICNNLRILRVSKSLTSFKEPPAQLPPYLNRIDVSNLKWDVESLTYFLNFICTYEWNYGLHLNISGSKIEDGKSWDDVFASLPDANNRITKLIWDGNPITVNFCHFIKKSKQLELISINNCQIDEQTTEISQKLSSAFLELVNLKKVLMFGKKTINHDALISIIRSLNNINLLDISGQPLTTEDFLIVANLITKKSLEAVKFDSINMSIEGIDNLLTAIEKAQLKMNLLMPIKTLKTLLKDNQINEETYNNFQKRFANIQGKEFPATAWNFNFDFPCYIPSIPSDSIASQLKPFVTGPILQINKSVNMNEIKNNNFEMESNQYDFSNGSSDDYFVPPKTNSKENHTKFDSEYSYSDTGENIDNDQKNLNKTKRTNTNIKKSKFSADYSDENEEEMNSKKSIQNGQIPKNKFLIEEEEVEEEDINEVKNKNRTKKFKRNDYRSKKEQEFSSEESYSEYEDETHVNNSPGNQNKQNPKDKQSLQNYQDEYYEEDEEDEFESKFKQGSNKHKLQKPKKFLSDSESTENEEEFDPKFKQNSNKLKQQKPQKFVSDSESTENEDGNQNVVNPNSNQNHQFSSDYSSEDDLHPIQGKRTQKFLLEYSNYESEINNHETKAKNALRHKKGKNNENDQLHNMKKGKIVTKEYSDEDEYEESSEDEKQKSKKDNSKPNNRFADYSDSNDQNNEPTPKQNTRIKPEIKSDLIKEDNQQNNQSKEEENKTDSDNWESDSDVNDVKIIQVMENPNGRFADSSDYSSIAPKNQKLLNQIPAPPLNSSSEESGFDKKSVQKSILSDLSSSSALKINMNPPTKMIRKNSGRFSSSSSYDSSNDLPVITVHNSITLSQDITEFSENIESNNNKNLLKKKDLLNSWSSSSDDQFTNKDFGKKGNFDNFEKIKREDNHKETNEEEDEINEILEPKSPSESNNSPNRDIKNRDSENNDDHQDDYPQQMMNNNELEDLSNNKSPQKSSEKVGENKHQKFTSSSSNSELQEEVNPNNNQQNDDINEINHQEISTNAKIETSSFKSYSNDSDVRKSKNENNSKISNDENKNKLEEISEKYDKINKVKKPVDEMSEQNNKSENSRKASMQSTKGRNKGIEDTKQKNENEKLNLPENEAKSKKKQFSFNFLQSSSNSSSDVFFKNQKNSNNPPTSTKSKFSSYSSDSSGMDLTINIKKGSANVNKNPNQKQIESESQKKYSPSTTKKFASSESSDEEIRRNFQNNENENESKNNEINSHEKNDEGNNDYDEKTLRIKQKLNTDQQYKNPSMNSNNGEKEENEKLPIENNKTEIISDSESSSYDFHPHKENRSHQKKLIQDTQENTHFGSDSSLDLENGKTNSKKAKSTKNHNKNTSLKEEKSKNENELVQNHNNSENSQTSKNEKETTKGSLFDASSDLSNTPIPIKPVQNKPIPIISNHKEDEKEKNRLKEPVLQTSSSQISNSKANSIFQKFLTSSSTSSESDLPLFNMKKFKKPLENTKANNLSKNEYICDNSDDNTQNIVQNNNQNNFDCENDDINNINVNNKFTPKETKNFDEISMKNKLEDEKTKNNQLSLNSQKKKSIPPPKLIPKKIVTAKPPPKLGSYSSQQNSVKSDTTKQMEEILPKQAFQKYLSDSSSNSNLNDNNNSNDNQNNSNDQMNTFNQNQLYNDVPKSPPNIQQQQNVPKSRKTAKPQSPTRLLDSSSEPSISSGIQRMQMQQYELMNQNNQAYLSESSSESFNFSNKTNNFKNKGENQNISINNNSHRKHRTLSASSSSSIPQQKPIVESEENELSDIFKPLEDTDLTDVLTIGLSSNKDNIENEIQLSVSEADTFSSNTPQPPTVTRKQRERIQKIGIFSSNEEEEENVQIFPFKRESQNRFIPRSLKNVNDNEEDERQEPQISRRKSLNTSHDVNENYENKRRRRSPHHIHNTYNDNKRNNRSNSQRSSNINSTFEDTNSNDIHITIKDNDSKRRRRHRHTINIVPNNYIDDYSSSGNEDVNSQRSSPHQRSQRKTRLSFSPALYWDDQNETHRSHRRSSRTSAHGSHHSPAPSPTKSHSKGASTTDQATLMEILYQNNKNSTFSRRKSHSTKHADQISFSKSGVVRKPTNLITSHRRETLDRRNLNSHDLNSSYSPPQSPSYTISHTSIHSSHRSSPNRNDSRNNSPHRNLSYKSPGVHANHHSHRSPRDNYDSPNHKKSHSHRYENNDIVEFGDDSPDWAKFPLKRLAHNSDRNIVNTLNEKFSVAQVLDMLKDKY